MTRILILPAIVAAALLIACGGGGSDPSPTPTEGITASPTPAPVPCTASNLYGALVSSEDANGTPILTIGISNTLTNCSLSGPPTVNWYDTAGTKLEVPAATKVDCQRDAGDYTTCVFANEVVLPGEGATPAADVSGQAVAVVGVRPEATCEAVTAHFIGLQFPDIDLDVQIELATDLTVPTCEGQVVVYGYGPLVTPAPE
jgi:hypothetical protein